MSLLSFTTVPVPPVIAISPCLYANAAESPDCQLMFPLS